MGTSNRFFLPSLGWLIVTTVLLTLPGDAFPGDGFFDKIPGFDKYVHIGIFSIMAVLFSRWMLKNNTPADKRIRYAIYCGFTGLLYGIIMEFVQKYFVPNRSFDSGDIIADAGGSLLGVLFAIRVYIKK